MKNYLICGYCYKKIFNELKEGKIILDGRSQYLICKECYDKVFPSQELRERLKIGL